MFGITRPTLVANGVAFGNLGCCMASADFSVTKLVAKASALRLATRFAAGVVWGMPLKRASQNDHAWHPRGKSFRPTTLGHNKFPAHYFGPQKVSSRLR